MSQSLGALASPLMNVLKETVDIDDLNKTDYYLIQDYGLHIYNFANYIKPIIGLLTGWHCQSVLS